MQYRFRLFGWGGEGGGEINGEGLFGEVGIYRVLAAGDVEEIDGGYCWTEGGGGDFVCLSYIVPLVNTVFEVLFVLKPVKFNSLIFDLLLSIDELPALPTFAFPLSPDI